MTQIFFSNFHQTLTQFRFSQMRRLSPTTTQSIEFTQSSKFNNFVMSIFGGVLMTIASLSNQFFNSTSIDDRWEWNLRIVQKILKHFRIPIRLILTSNSNILWLKISEICVFYSHSISIPPTQRWEIISRLKLGKSDRNFVHNLGWHATLKRSQFSNSIVFCRRWKKKDFPGIIRWCDIAAVLMKHRKNISRRNYWHKTERK